MHQSCALISISRKDVCKRRPPLVANLKCSSVMYKKYFSCDCYDFRCCMSLNTLTILSVFAFHIWDQFQRVFYSIFCKFTLLFLLFWKKKRTRCRFQKNLPFYEVHLFRQIPWESLFLISRYIKELQTEKWEIKLAIYVYKFCWSLWN